MQHNDALAKYSYRSVNPVKNWSQICRSDIETRWLDAAIGQTVDPGWMELSVREGDRVVSGVNGDKDLADLTHQLPAATQGSLQGHYRITAGITTTDHCKDHYKDHYRDHYRITTWITAGITTGSKDQYRSLQDQYRDHCSKITLITGRLHSAQYT